MREIIIKKNKTPQQITGNQLTDFTVLTAITSRQILLSLLDVGAFSIYLSDRTHFYRPLMKGYFKWRNQDKNRFHSLVNRLKKQGLIRAYYEGKKPVLALTEKGKKRALRAVIDTIQIIQPNVWDHKWHLIIFDIPEKNRSARTVFRKRLRDLGFFQVQKSVFIHPFDATDLVSGIRRSFNLNQEIQYIVADQIEQEIELINHFLAKGILTPQLIKQKMVKK